jgi:hypothetical protein
VAEERSQPLLVQALNGRLVELDCPKQCQLASGRGAAEPKAHA